MRYAVIFLLLSGCVSAPEYYPLYPAQYPVYSSSRGGSGGFSGQNPDAPTASSAPCTSSNDDSANSPPLGMYPCTSPLMSTYPEYGYGLPWSAYPGYGYALPWSAYPGYYGYGLSMGPPYPAYGYAWPFYGASYFGASYYRASYYRAPYYGPRYYSAAYAGRPTTSTPRYSHTHGGGRRGKK